MPQPTFTTVKNDFEISATSSALWTVALEYVAGATKLKIEVIDLTSVWQYSTDHWCRAGGTMRNEVAALLPSAPIGALIGKLGGGTADCPAPPGASGPSPMPAGNKVFSVGTYAIIDVKAEDSGPLFLAMNDVLAGFPQHAGSVKVKISTGA